MYFLSSFIMVVIVTAMLKIHFPTVQSNPSLSSVVTSKKVNIENTKISKQAYSDKNVKKVIHSHYVLNPTKTRKLALVEQQLVVPLFNIQDKTTGLTKEDLCHIYLSKYLHEFDQDTMATKEQRGINRANMVVENPILILKMIRRLVVTLMNNTLSSCQSNFPEIAKIVNNIFNFANLVPPTLEDLDDALLELLRIQYTYGINATNALRLGNLNGIYTKAFLYFDDCLALGQKAVEIGAQSMAYQWLTSAPLSPPEIDCPQEHLVKDMHDLDQTWMALLNLTLIGDWDHMHEYLRDKPEKTLEFFSANYSSYTMCRGEPTLSAAYQSSLICFYNFHWDPYFLINPVKTEVLSEYPTIFQFYDFVNNETIDFIRKSAVTNEARSEGETGKKLQAEYKGYGASTKSWIYGTKKQNVDPLLVTLKKRIEKLTALEVHKKGASNMQVVVHGSLGGHYGIHHDALQVGNVPIEQYGDRIAVLQLFLSDVQVGGHITFPDAGVFAKPIKGSAVLWYPLKLSGLPDIMISHSGCPVVLGIKEVANVWILQYENMWKHSCSLYSDE